MGMSIAHLPKEGHCVNPILWIVAGIVLIVVEMMSATFVLVWLGVAALVTGLGALFIHDLLMQVAIFGLLSVVLLALTRPLARKLRERKTGYVSNVEHLVGERGIVIGRIAEGRTGMVRVGSDVWSARGNKPTDAIEAGEWVEVKAVRSSTLVVEKTEK